jgi:type IV secretory pathway TrbL component
MKNFLKLALVAAGVFTFAQSQAKSMVNDTTKISKTVKKVGHETSKTAKTVGHTTAETATKVAHKTSEVAAKGAAAITDKKYEGKCGPHGETVYINKDSKYFYVNKTGHRVYVTKSHLMDASKMKMEKED